MLLILPGPAPPPVQRATETELKRERPAAGVVAEAVLKLLRLPVWKVMLDCLDMVAERGRRGELLTRARAAGDREDGAPGEPRAALAFMGLREGRGAAQGGL